MCAVLILCWAPTATAESWPDKLALLDKLRQGEFDAIDAQLSGYQKAFEADQLSELIVIHAFGAFGHSGAELEPLLHQWNERHPDSFAAAVARGAYFSHLGWLARGGAYAKGTPDERFAAMKEYHALAIEDLARAIRINPKASIAYALLLSTTKSSVSKTTREQLIRMGLEAVPTSYTIRYSALSGLLPWWGGSLDEIRAFITEMKPRAENTPELRPLLGYADYVTAETWRRAGKRKEAIQYYDRALRYGDYWFYRYQRGLNFYKLKRYEEALADFDQIIALRPQLASVLDARARTYRRQGRCDDALADWDLALKLDPRDPDYLRNRAFALRQQGRYAEARSDLDAALDFGAYDSAVRAARGRLFLFSLKDYRAAAEELREATNLAPTRDDYWYD
ncbi:MAG: tetratricopeptide repeat protein [Rhodospirillales bacterium]|nr:tetratricopeptide repeat protein [Rhodospirillales bacterium]